MSSVVSGPAHKEAGEEQVIPKDLPRPGRRALIGTVIVAAVMLLGLFVIGWIPRHARQATAQSDADDVAQQAPIVNVAYPTPAPSTRQIVLPANVLANQQTDIYPRAMGYLQELKHDINDHVNDGELLAVISAPDVDTDLAQAQATLLQTKAAVIKAEADVKLAAVTLKRYLDAEKNSPGSVTQQDIDQNQASYDDAVSALAQSRASVVAQDAAVQHLAVLKSFENVTAPFAGTITIRHYDVGALLNPATTGAGTQLFTIVDATMMRVFVDVPQRDAALIKLGQPARLSVNSYPGRVFPGFVARSSDAIDPGTRTMALELHFKNPDGALKANMSATASLDVVEPKPVLLIPTSAMLFNANGVQVAVVRDGKAYLLSNIQVGRDFGSQIEVTVGLSADDQVVVNPGERLADGVAVIVRGSTTRPAAMQPTTAP